MESYITTEIFFWTIGGLAGIIGIMWNYINSMRTNFNNSIKELDNEIEAVKDVHIETRVELASIKKDILYMTSILEELKRKDN